MSEYTPTEVERERLHEAAERLRHYGYGHLSEAVERATESLTNMLAGLRAEVRADERAKALDAHKCDEQAERAYRRAVAAEQALRDERAKRPDRQQIYKAIREEAKSVDSPCPPWLASRYADAVLALEPEAREEPVSVARVLHALASLAEEVINIGDVAEIVAMPPGTTGLAAAVDARDSLYEEPATWIRAQVDRLHQLLPASEAREEADYFRDGDGDLWKFTDKGEWFHEEELGEFRQVLSIDAEDQTLTPVSHAELAPAPEVTDAEVEAAAQALCGMRYGGNGKLVKTGNPQDYRNARAALEAAWEVE